MECSVHWSRASDAAESVESGPAAKSLGKSTNWDRQWKQAGSGFWRSMSAFRQGHAPEARSWRVSPAGRGKCLRIKVSLLECR
jgi:hypothetical protein